MAEWKKVVVSGSDISQLNNDANYLINGQSGATLTGSFSGSFTGTTNLPDLTSGEGISTFTYDGSATATVAVSGAADLSNNAVTKWNDTDGKFANSNITDDGTLVTIDSNTTVSGSLTVTGNVIGTGSLKLQPDSNDARYLEIYNTAAQDTHITASGGWLFLGDDTTYVKVDNYSTNNSMELRADNGISVTGSLNVTGSNVQVITDDFTVGGTGGARLTVTPAAGVNIYDINFFSSADFDTRQLVKSDGTTVTVDWENGLFSGSFSGSFQGDGSQLTGVTATSLANSLSQGTGITAFTFNGSTAQTVEVSGSGTLSVNTLTKWTGDAFADTSITDDGTLVTVTNDALFQGDIIVQGTASFQSTQNLLVADRFVLFASGSVATGDGGIVVQQGTQNVGELYGYDSTTTRWGFTSSFNSATGTSFTPAVYVGAVQTGIGQTAASAAPIYGGSSFGYGTIHVDTDDSEIWIYA
jgi:hypothetical protein